MCFYCQVWCSCLHLPRMEASVAGPGLPCLQKTQGALNPGLPKALSLRWPLVPLPWFSSWVLSMGALSERRGVRGLTHHVCSKPTHTRKAPHSEIKVTNRPPRGYWWDPSVGLPSQIPTAEVRCHACCHPSLAPAPAILTGWELNNGPDLPWRRSRAIPGGSRRCLFAPPHCIPELLGFAASAGASCCSSGLLQLGWGPRLGRQGWQSAPADDDNCMGRVASPLVLHRGLKPGPSKLSVR